MSDKDKRVQKKDQRRFKHIESQSKDYGRYGRTPKEVPPKPLSTTETKQSKEEIMEKEIKKSHEKKLQDPVCKKTVYSKNVQFKKIHHQKEFVFCSLECQQAFEKEPEKYL